MFIKKENPEAPREEWLGTRMYQLSWHDNNNNSYNTFVHEVENYSRYWNVKVDLRTFQGWSLLILVRRRRFMPFFACTIVRSNVGYRLAISFFCRCQSGLNFPFTTVSETFSSSLTVRFKSLTCVSIWNIPFKLWLCSPKARSTPLMTCYTSGSLRPPS